MNKTAKQNQLSNHAADAILKREIKYKWLEYTLERPDIVEADPYEPTFEHRLASIKEFDGRVLRVVVNPTRSPLFVITLFFDRRKERIWNETKN